MLVCTQQFFKRKWTWEIYLKSYEDAQPIRKLFIPKPVRSAFQLAEERYGDAPAVDVYNFEQVLRVVQKVGAVFCMKLAAPLLRLHTSCYEAAVVCVHGTQRNLLFYFVLLFKLHSGVSGT